jgi:4-amino-4-deoxy-L-arabinose transferase-like glycosyltransferase
MCCRLSELNERWSLHPRASFVGIAVFCVATACFLGHYASKYGLNSPPSSTGDEPSYDSLGWQLSRGRGFSVNYRDPEFRAPYDRAARKDPALFTLAPGKSGPITYRPPLFPLLIAGTNVLFGRQFWMIRVVDSIAIAATCGLMAQYVFRSAGLLPALIGAATFVVVDYRTRLYGRAIMSEALACVLVACLALTIIKSASSGKIRWMFLAGGIAGLCILTRTMLVLWLPGLAVTMFFARRSASQDKAARVAVVHSCLFVATALLVVLPWMIRNSIVLESFKPLGTQGLTQLSAGFSDEALAHLGVWHNTSQREIFDAVVKPDMSTIEVELAMAEHSSRLAFRWILHNPHKALLLAPLKIFSEFQPYTLSEAFVACFALIGLALTIKTLSGKVFCGMILTNALAVAVTWSVSGRFLVPLLFVIHVLAAVGLWSTLLMVTDYLQHTWARLNI